MTFAQASDYTAGQLTITPQMIRARLALSRELPANATDVRMVMDEFANRVTVEVSRVLYRDVRRVDHTQRWTQEVPWSATVAVTIPNGWWRRLLRRRERIVAQDVTGTVLAGGEVRVSGEAGYAFPDMDPALYPAHLGTPVRVLQVAPHPTLDWYQTSPTFGAAERWE